MTDGTGVSGARERIANRRISFKCFSMTFSASVGEGDAFRQRVDIDLPMVGWIAPSSTMSATAFVRDLAVVLMATRTILFSDSEPSQVVSVAGLAEIRIGRLLHEGLQEKPATMNLSIHPSL